MIDKTEENFAMSHGQARHGVPDPNETAIDLKEPPRKVSLGVPMLEGAVEL